ncbi:hypothetical protein BM1_00044 [Bipolaris maydis]|nr:hypothetical protein BM1_00044 [Bipolaris maydis]
MQSAPGSSKHLIAILKEDEHQFERALEDSPPDEKAIEELVKHGLNGLVKILVHSPQLWAKYGDENQTVVHYIASYGNIEQLDEITETTHWEKLKDVRDSGGRTALNIVSELLNRKKEVFEVDHVTKRAEKLKAISEQMNVFTPWAAEDLNYETYFEELEQIKKAILYPEEIG